MKEVEVFTGPFCCGKYVGGQGWTIEIPVEQLKNKGYFKNQNVSRVEKENAELQKQVDELKEENAELHKERTILIAGSILQKEQAVKGTAKLIANWLITTESDKENLAKIIKEHYGVEVE